MRWLKDSIAPDFGEIVAQRLYDFKSEAETEHDRKQFTHRAVAKRVGFKSAASIARITQGRRITMLRPSQFWALAEALDFSPNVMLEAAGYLAPPVKVWKTPTRSKRVTIPKTPIDSKRATRLDKPNGDKRATPQKAPNHRKRT